jgi:hypothetical protein
MEGPSASGRATYLVNISCVFSRKSLTQRPACVGSRRNTFLQRVFIEITPPSALPVETDALHLSSFGDVPRASSRELRFSRGVSRRAFYASLAVSLATPKLISKLVVVSLSPVITIIASTIPAGARWPLANRWMKNEFVC